MSNNTQPLQYYFKKSRCTADNAGDDDCICWHDQGSGPLAHLSEYDSAVRWRRKPCPQPEQEWEPTPGERCELRLDRKSYDVYVVGISSWNTVVIESTKVNGQLYDGFSRANFRPLRSPRDRAIDAALGEIVQDYTCPQRPGPEEYVKDAVTQLYGAGLLREVE